MGQAQTKASLGLVNSQLRRKMTFALRTAEGLQGSGYWRSVAGDKVFCWPGRWNTLPQPGGHPGPHLPQQPGKLSRGQESLGSLVFLPVFLLAEVYFKLALCCHLVAKAGQVPLFLAELPERPSIPFGDPKPIVLFYRASQFSSSVH